MKRRVPAPDPTREDHDAETIPLDLGVFPDVEPGRIAVAMPPTKSYRIGRDVRLELEEHEAQKAARQNRRRDVRVGVLVRHDPLSGGTFVEGVWSVVARSTHPSSWIAVPWSQSAVGWAAANDVRSIDADVLMLAPARS